MADIETLIRKNSIVKRLIAEGNLSREYLKKIFRNLCKITHPDLDKKPGQTPDEAAGAAFIRLKAEYEEAKSNLDRLQAFLLGTGSGGVVLGAKDIERMFYDTLRHYIAAGLYSLRMRIKPELKKRNELILREMVYWAKLHDPAFIDVFLKYNKTYFLRRFSEWQRRDDLMKAQKLFQRGFSTTVDYADNRSPHTLRTARLCFNDAASLAGSLASQPLAKAMLEFILWFQAELDRLSGKKKATAADPEYPEPDLPEGQHHDK